MNKHNANQRTEPGGEGRREGQNDPNRQQSSDISGIDRQEGDLHHGETGGAGAADSVPGTTQTDANERPKDH